MVTVPLMVFKTIDRIPFMSSVLVTLGCSTLSLSLAVNDETPHDIFVIDMKELMQALIKITKKMIQHDVKQIFRKRIQLGSMMKGSSSSYVKLVVITLLLK